MKFFQKLEMAQEKKHILTRTRVSIVSTSKKPGVEANICDPNSKGGKEQEDFWGVPGKPVYLKWQAHIQIETLFKN